MKNLDKHQFVKLKVTKIEPNSKINLYKGITVNYLIGYTHKLPTLGEQFRLENWHTSKVTEELNDNNEFKTENSTYKLELL